MNAIDSSIDGKKHRLTWVLWIQRPAIDMRLSRKLGSHRGGPPVSSGRSRGCVGVVPRDLPCHWAKLGAWSRATTNCLPKRAAQSNGLLHYALQWHQAKPLQSMGAHSILQTRNSDDDLAAPLCMMSPSGHHMQMNRCPNLQVTLSNNGTMVTSIPTLSMHHL